MAYQNNKIDDLPPNIKKELATALDSRNSSNGNWRALIQLMSPTVVYQRSQIESFAMTILQPHGSPTRALLTDLAIRGITVPQLVRWISQLHSRTQSHQLQALLTLFQQMPLEIIKQPNELYRQPKGSSVAIHCEASPSTSLSYQWFKRKEPLAGKTQPFLQLSDVCQEDEGYYICRVANTTGQYVFSNWTKVELTDSENHLAKPLITTQPRCTQIALGGMLCLYCDAVGDPAPEYQWYRNDCPIPRAKQREYNKTNMSLDDGGKFFCIASNSSGQTVSDVIDVLVVKHSALSPTTTRGVERGVSDKIALLIGNKDYKNGKLSKLYHPTNDVCDLAGMLRSIGFKVVSLVDLTLAEMRFAVQQFCKLLDKDMYALFYFAGHGFEDGNQSYLMPVDASNTYDTKENLSASEVIQPMQSSQAKLNVILLDSCRTRPSRTETPRPDPGLNIEKKNVIIAFGCCSRKPVFENEAKTNGYFAIYLLKNLGKEDDVDAVLRDVSRDIDDEDIRDPENDQKQVVFRQSTLTEALSLRAPLNPNAIINSTDGWKAAHEIPETPIEVFNEDGCVVDLMFYAEFSNVLLVKARVQEGSEAFVNFTLDQKECNGCVMEQITEKEPTLPDRFRSNQAIRIRDLQRLKGDLVINLEIRIEKESKPKSIQYRMKDKPLYAKIVQA
ncbi:mucosa-associated lymphoid tissue lymphoma translocation protein 1 homolog [Actinia tenebrosa]|uniref:Mucosa-associated lymphoid tissue lymphoma translocation protein 1 homolog n=1 Tax=Actinia tenebrosa TaxID=6105 RepID=A0A6P8J277_ACTTE|nr:mucosa-associated lymphoid tissue lymphoma translocation protein 1 homolog [Actinia tenebrosa]XP_031573655.1 mucosa-associated lymphoid tissue lymphoma translocation protein 1 homolog [Actinia tenebrosa]